jgi:hypothetical protein
MIGYHENWSKINSNLNFEFDNTKNQLPVGVIGKPVKNRISKFGRKMAKITRRTIDDETEGLVSGEAVDAK